MDKDMLISMLMDGTCLIECNSHEERCGIVEAMIAGKTVFSSSDLVTITSKRFPMYLLLTEPVTSARIP